MKKNAVDIFTMSQCINTMIAINKQLFVLKKRNYNNYCQLNIVTVCFNYKSNSIL